MEEEERPRKIQKVEVNEAHDSEPPMTGAVEGSQNNASEPTNTQDATPAETTEKGAVEPAAAPEGSESTPVLSKRQRKKQARLAHWEEGREARKIVRKEKAAAKKARKREAWDEAKKQGLNPSEELQKLYPRPLRSRNRKPTRLPLTLIVDCGFDELMEHRERISLGQQIARAYSENSKAKFNAHLVVSSFNKLLKERYETVLHNTHKGWRNVRFIGEDYLYAANQAKEWMQGPKGGQLVGPFEDSTEAKPEDGEIVYLSSDSPETLTELKPYSTYIIGGLVDKNRHKGLCHKRATEMGLRTAKLPIGQYIEMASRTVLATNHVVEIMVRWMQLRDWGEAFMQTIPTRKGGVLKGTGGSTPQDDDADDAEDGDDADSGDEQNAMIEAAEAAENAEADNDLAEDNERSG